MVAHEVKDKADFDTKMQEAHGRLVVVGFFATWCGPCKLMKPIFEELSEQFASSAIFLKVDVDDCEDLTSEFGVTAMPTIMFIRNNKRLQSVTGATEDKIKELLHKL